MVASCCEGFYDDVVPLSDTDRAEIARVPYDQESVRQKLGIDAFFGEPGYTTLERSWGRPTLEVNGIWGGFQGEGVKTVLPSEAHAKITCRLVANQRPEKIAALLAEHVAQHTPPGAKVTVSIKENGALPYLMSGDHPGNAAARDVLVEIYGKEPFLARSGRQHPGDGDVPGITGRVHDQLWLCLERRATALTQRVFPAGKLCARTARVLHTASPSRRIGSIVRSSSDQTTTSVGSTSCMQGREI
jgi:hypothetical protein